MAKMPKEVIDALGNEHALKMMATVNEAGIPNAAVIATVTALGEDMIAFADFRMRKTRENLDKNGKFAVTVLTPDLKAYQIKGRCEGFQDQGPLAEAVNELVYSKVRMQIKAVGLGSVEEVYSVSMQNPGEKLA